MTSPEQSPSGIEESLNTSLNSRKGSRGVKKSWLTYVAIGDSEDGSVFQGKLQIQNKSSIIGEEGEKLIQFNCKVSNNFN
jgi:hypothetical protein